MKKVEAPTLEEAYQIAATHLSCAISNLEYEVIQYPSSGILGFLKKNAIIVATCKQNRAKHISAIKKIPKEEALKQPMPKIEESVASEIIDTVKEEMKKEVVVTPTPTPPAPLPVVEPKIIEPKVEKDSIVDGFFEKESAEIARLEEKVVEAVEEEAVVYDELALLIETQLKELLSHSCFAIDVVEVDVVDNTALIFIDGDDAALLIGKEGYRYNALSYMIFNWLHAKYELFIKLEIAEFLTTQQDMISHYIKPVIANVEKYGKGKTRFLDGILVQIALEQLREQFPDKYVAVKTSKEGKKFIVINQFNNKKPNV